MSFSTPTTIVGTISRYDPQTRKTTNPISIICDDEIFIGRDQKRCNYTINNPHISNKHLRLYTILFDRDNPTEVAPLVYAQDLSMNGTTWNGYAMGGKGSGSFLLSHGDLLGLAPDVYLVFGCEGHVEEGEGRAFDVLQSVEMKVFQEMYAITPRKLGSGAYGKVHMAYKKETGQQLACKVVDLRALRERAKREVEEQRSKYYKTKWQESMAARRGDGDCGRGGGAIANVLAVQGKEDYLARKVREKLAIYHREARVLASLCHPNIIGIEKVINTSNTIYLFQDLVTAGDLFSFIQYKGGKLGDIESAVIVRQVLMALDYLHDHGIVHRDLKPDNILMTSLADGGRVVLTDFGCARLVKPTAERMSTMIGTFEYSAPEVHRSSYTKAVDLWSLGCVTAVLLTGDSPFRTPDAPNEPAQAPCASDFDRLEADLEWSNTGARARSFVRGLLVLDEGKRMSVKQALQHKWFTNRALKGEFEALYRRSIRDWRPRVQRGRLIVDLCHLIQTRTSEGPVSAVGAGADAGGSTGGKESQLSGQLSSTDASQDSSYCEHRPVSPTLSDLELPEHPRVREPSVDWEKGDDLISTDEDLFPLDQKGYTSLNQVPVPASQLGPLNAATYCPKRQPGQPLSVSMDEGCAASTKARNGDIWAIPIEDEVYDENGNVIT